MKDPDYRDFETIVFDLGNVIIDLNDKLVLDEFVRQSQKTENEILAILVESSLFEDFETGRIGEIEFMREATSRLGVNMSEEEFRRIWNLTLHHLPFQKLELLNSLSSTHKVFILSNTNSIHLTAFDDMVGNLFPGKVMNDFVEKAYYSHEMGLRKPEVEIYEMLMDREQLSSRDVLFFDDKEENIVGATKVGITGVQVKKPEELWDYFAF